MDFTNCAAAHTENWRMHSISKSSRALFGCGYFSFLHTIGVHCNYIIAESRQNPGSLFARISFIIEARRREYVRALNQTLKIYDLVERTETVPNAPQKPGVEFVTRKEFDALAALVGELKGKKKRKEEDDDE